MGRHRKFSGDYPLYTLITYIIKIPFPFQFMLSLDNYGNHEFLQKIWVSYQKSQNFSYSS